MAKGLRTARRLLGPRWLTTDGDSEQIGYSLDIVKDAQLGRLELGLLARFPEQDPNGTPAPADALAALGRDRRVVRGLNESARTYAQRLKRWLDDRKRAGNPFALMQKLAEYTGPGPAFRTVDARGNWFSRAADGTRTALLNQANWDWDGSPFTPDGKLRWSRFWVVIYPNGLWEPSAHEWGDPTSPGFGDGVGTFGSTATLSEVDTVRSIVADWKPEGTRCVNIILAFDPASFNPLSPEPDGLWGNGSKNVGGVQVPSRLRTARYWQGI